MRTYKLQSFPGSPQHFLPMFPSPFPSVLIPRLQRSTQNETLSVLNHIITTESPLGRNGTPFSWSKGPEQK